MIRIQGSLNHELPEKVCKFLTQKIFSPSYYRYVTLKAQLPLPSLSCKGEACLPRSHFKGETSSLKLYIEGYSRLKQLHRVHSRHSTYLAKYNNKNFAAVTPRTIRFSLLLQCSCTCSTLLYPRVVFGAHDNRFHYMTRAENCKFCAHLMSPLICTWFCCRSFHILRGSFRVNDVYYVTSYYCIVVCRLFLL